MAVCPAIEAIYSSRDTVDADMPSYTSDNALRAFEKVMEVKEKISSGTYEMLFFYY